MNDTIFRTESGFAVKTLYLGPLGKGMVVDHLLNHFSTYGNVQNVEIHTNATNSFGFVTFQEAEAAAAALKMKFHVIAGRKLCVEIANNSHIYEPAIIEDLPLKLANATGTQFLDLHDDCIQKILTKVTVMDLCSLAETSSHLKVMATEAFKRNHSSFDLIEANDPDNLRIISKFGSLIVELWDVWGDWFYDSKRNRDPRIYEMLFARCQSLVQYKFSDVHANCAMTFGNIFPKLEIFSYEHLWIDDHPNLEIFISNHKNLKSIELLGNSHYSYLLPIIADNCHKLEKLKISGFNPVEYHGYQQAIHIFSNHKLQIREDENFEEWFESKRSTFVQQLKLSRSLGALEWNYDCEKYMVPKWTIIIPTDPLIHFGLEQDL